MSVKKFYDYLSSKNETLHKHEYKDGSFFENELMHIEFDAKITMFELSVYAEEPYAVIATEKSPDLENLIGLAKYIVEKYTQLQTLERTVPESLDMTKRAFEQQVN